MGEEPSASSAERSAAGRRPRHPGRDSPLTNPRHKKQPRVGGGESRRSPRRRGRARESDSSPPPIRGCSDTALPSRSELELPLASPGSARDLRRGAKGRRSPTHGPECPPRRSAAVAGAAPRSGRGPAAAPQPHRQLHWVPLGSPQDRSSGGKTPSSAAHTYLSEVRSARPPRPLHRPPSPRCPPAAGPWPRPTPRRHPRAVAPRCVAPRHADRRGRTCLLPPSTLRGERRGEMGPNAPHPSPAPGTPSSAPAVSSAWISTTRPSIAGHSVPAAAQLSPTPQRLFVRAAPPRVEGGGAGQGGAGGRPSSGKGFPRPPRGRLRRGAFVALRGVQDALWSLILPWKVVWRGAGLP